MTLFARAARARIEHDIPRRTRIPFRTQADPRPTAASAWRLPLLRRAGRGAVRRQGARPEKARVELLHENAAVAAHRDDDHAHRAHRDHGHALGGRGAAAREQPDQGARAALQHPVSRRQVVSVPEAHGPSVSANGVLPRRGRQEEPVLRAVSERVGGAREHPDPAARVPVAHLRGLGVQQPHAPVPAAPDRPLLGAVRRRDRRGGLRARRRQRVAFPARPAGRGDGRARAKDARVCRRAEVRAGRGRAQPDELAREGAASAGDRRWRRQRRRHPRGRRAGRPCVREPCDGARRPASRRQGVFPGARRNRARARGRYRSAGRRRRRRRRAGRGAARASAARDGRGCDGCGGD
ncbi:putative uvrABC system protein C [Burkholderia pseudomallei]|nr:putative uvrABC system protein C [Burkholderia pseudomallei]